MGMVGTILRGIRLSKVSSSLLALLLLATTDEGRAQTRPQTQRVRPRALRRSGLVLRRQLPRHRAPFKRGTACAGMEKLPVRDERPFEIGEELAYEIVVAGAYVGRLETKIGAPRNLDGKTVIPLFGRARTSVFVSTVQPFEGRYMALVDPETLAPVGVRVEGTYGGDARWERIRFLQGQRKVTAEFLLRGQERTRTYVGRHDLTDILTMLYAARRIRLARGLSGCQDVFGARRLWRMDAVVKNLVEVDTPAGRRRAYEVATVFDRRPTPGLSSTKRPHFEIDVFLSDDSSQAPLRFVMRQGGVTAEAKLVRWSLRGVKGAKPPVESDWTF